MAVERTVTVTGQGSVSVVPDQAVLRVSAVARAATVGEAFGQTAEAVEVLLATARSAVPEAGISSDGVDVYSEGDDRRSRSWFTCQHSVTVRCSSLETASALLSALVDAVGDRLQVRGVSLEVADTAAAYAEARAAAYTDAVARATALAELADVRLGDAVTIVEGEGSGWSPQRAPRAAAYASMPIAAGEQSVSAAVTVTFALV